MTYEINHRPLNSFPLNGMAYNDPGVIATGSGSLVDFLQTVVAEGSGSLIDFEQTVVYSQTGSGALIDFVQSVIAQGSGALVNIRQAVVNQNTYTYYQRNGWYPIISLGGSRVIDEMVKDFSVTATEGDSKQATVQLKLFPGTYDLDNFVGSPIVITIIKNNASYTVFTGVVNLPDLDLINWTLTLSCTDLRRELIDSTYANFVKNVGYYSNAVFGDGTGAASDELDNRLTTIPYSVDFDGSNTLLYAPLMPKAFPDVTFNTDKISRARPPTYQKAIRSRITNSVKIKFTYQYQRSYQITRVFNWTNRYGGLCPFLYYNYSIARRDMIESAVNSAGWPVLNGIAYDDVILNGYYRCFSVPGAQLPGGGLTIGFSTIATTSATGNVTDTNGNVVKDASGNAIQRSAIISAVDLRPLLCFGASWTAGTRFTQNMQENYTLTVRAPQSVNRYGLVETSESASVTSEYSENLWEGSKKIGRPVGQTTVPNSGFNYYFDNHTNYQEYYNSMYAVLNRAKTTILKAHRSDKVMFSTKEVEPYINMAMTIKLNSDRIVCLGKVTSYTHTFNVTDGSAYSEVELSLSRAPGGATDDVLSIPTPPAYNPSLGATGVALGSIYGEEPGENQTGFVGNKGAGSARTSIAESFTVTVPEIPNDLRGNKALEASGLYSVNIPNNLLQLVIKV